MWEEGNRIHFQSKVCSINNRLFIVHLSAFFQLNHIANYYYWLLTNSPGSVWQQQWQRV